MMLSTIRPMRYASHPRQRSLNVANTRRKPARTKSFTSLARLTALLALCGNAVTYARPVLADQAASCQLWTSDSRIDYEPRTKDMLSAAADNATRLSFGRRTVQLSATCDKPAHFALSFEGPPTERGAFRFGDQGRLKLRLENAQLDGQTVPMIHVLRASGPSRQASYSLPIRPGDRVAVAPGYAQEGKQWSARLTIDPFIPTAAARVSGRTSFDSDLSIQLTTP